MSEVETAMQIAKAAHAGQKRRDGKPYWTHLWAVSQLVSTPDQKVVAWLHDVMEDTPVGAAHLRESGISEDNIHRIIRLTHRLNESYLDYILRVQRDPVATRVKLADLDHNLIDSKHGSLREKYLLARYILSHTSSSNQ